MKKKPIIESEFELSDTDKIKAWAIKCGYFYKNYKFRYDYDALGITELIAKQMVLESGGDYDESNVSDLQECIIKDYEEDTGNIIA